MNKQVFIIGSGVAGLASAIRLAVKGYEVKVFEKNSYPGGKISAVEENGYLFDAGPSLFTQPALLKELFEYAGENINDYISYEKLDVTCKYFYENGKVITAYSDLQLFEEELNSKTGEVPGRITTYLDRSKKLYESIGSVFLNHSMHKSGTWLHPRIIRAIGNLRLPYINRSLDKYHRSRFRSPETVQLFNRYATYNGSDPYRAPAMLSMVPHLEHNEGVYYPKGGMITIARALHRLAEKKGVEFYFNSPVQRIIHMEGKVKGIVVDGKNYFSDIVISNTDAYLTYRSLLQHQPRADKLLKHERSSSALVFFWGIRKQFQELDLHNIFFSKDYKEEFRNIFSGQMQYADPTIYINNTSKLEPEHAPAGCSNWFVMTNVPPHSGQDWEVMAEKSRRFIIEKLNRLLNTDIESLLDYEKVMTPADIETLTGCYGGSLYGPSSNTRMAAFRRHPNFTNYIKGLYFCGGTVHPGGGIPLCLKSAEITAELISSKSKPNPSG